MSKMTFLITLFIVLPTSGALEVIYLPPTFHVHSDNRVVGIDFKTKGVLGAGGTAQQGRGLMIGQAAGAIGLGGISGVNQHVGVSGSQTQNIASPMTATDTSPATAQAQGLNVNARQTALKFGGVGGAGGLQGALVGQKQVTVSPDGFSSQSQLVGIGQSAAVAGGPGSIAVVHQSVKVKTLQFQLND